MRVLVITDTIHAGGAETFVLRLVSKLNELGIEAEILSLNQDIEDKELIQQYRNIRIHRINIPILKWIKRVDKILRALKIDFSVQYYLTRRIIVRKYLSKYTLFHTHLISVDYLFARIKMEHSKMCVISTLHGDYNEFELFWEKNSIHKKLNWPKKVALLKQNINNWVYISEQQYTLFNSIYKLPERVLHKIYNGYEDSRGVNLEKKYLKTNEGLQFIMVARGIEAKGWEYLIKAFIRLKSGHKLLLVGKGDYIERLKAKYSHDQNINFFGFHPRPIDLINKSDVFVFPSVYKTESLPTVIIEALYCGVPVISTNIGEVAEMITDPSTGSKAGILIEKENEDLIVQSLHDAMNVYVDDRSKLEHHSIVAKRAFEKFDMEVCCKRYIKLYKQSLAII